MYMAKCIYDFLNSSCLRHIASCNNISHIPHVYPPFMFFHM